MSLPDVLKAYSDDALAALASVGVLKRAQKDRESVEATVLSYAGEGAELTIAGFAVSIPAKGPAAARCTCPAPGICRHIVHAVLVLREAASGASAEDVPGPSAPLIDDLVALSADAVAKLAGAGLDEAIALTRLVADVAPSEDRMSLRITFPAIPAEVTFVLGTPPGEALYKGPKTRRRAAVAAALIVARERAGVSRPASDTPDGAASGLDPEWLTACGRTLEAALPQVFRGMAEPAADALLDLAISARADAAPRIASELLTLSNLARLADSRDIGFDPPEFVARLSRTYALSVALMQPDAGPDLTGSPRRVYAETGPLTLLMLGAESWTTASGGRGLTLHSRDQATGRAMRLTVARAAGADPSFNPASAYRTVLMGIAPPSMLVGGLVHIGRPFVAEDGSLSPSRCTDVAIGRKLLLADIAAGGFGHSNWTDLIAESHEALGSGLRRGMVPATDLLLDPASGAVEFDEIAQGFSLAVRDAQGETRTVGIPSESAEDAAATASLIHRARAVLVEIVPDWNGIRTRLVSVLHGDASGLSVFNASLDIVPAVTRVQKLTERAARLLRRERAPAEEATRVFADRVLAALADLWRARPSSATTALAREAEMRQLLTLARLLERTGQRTDARETLACAYCASCLSCDLGSEGSKSWLTSAAS